MAEKLAKNKPLFILLSCSSVACLVGSFGYPLQQVEIYKQAELGSFGNQYIRTFIVSESDQDYPYGFDSHKAKKYAQIYQDAKWQKIILLLLAGSSAITAIGMGQDTCLHSEIDDEVLEVKARGKKELILENVKHRLAMASKSQRLLFLDEMKALMAEFGSQEQEIQEVDEINALYSAEPLERQEEVVEVVEIEEDFRSLFPEQVDGISWKAITKAIGNGATEGEVVTDVLGCTESTRHIGISYLNYLKGKYAVEKIANEDS